MDNVETLLECLPTEKGLALIKIGLFVVFNVRFLVRRATCGMVTRLTRLTRRSRDGARPAKQYTDALPLSLIFCENLKT